MKRSGLKRGTSTLKRTDLKSAAHARIAAKEAGAVTKLHAAVQREPKTKPMKSRGFKGRAPTPAEQRFMDGMAALGCIACRKDGVENPWISIHHIDGRTKEGAHFKVLALCAPHHQQDDSDPMGRISVHGNKARFEARYGTQAELLAECVEIINSQAAQVIAGALAQENI